MTDKQIIDGEECRYWFRPNPDDYRKCSLRGKNDNCDEITDCFIKELLGKLALKEQECEELKKQRESDKGLITSIGKQNYQLLQEYDKLKTALTEIKEIAKNSCCLQPTSTCEEYENCKECSRTSDDETVK